MEKSAEAFRTISEVSEYLDTPAHVLRFWESRFSQVKPVKRAGGRRYYRPTDLALLGGIKKLLHEDGLTIRGVQKILKEQGVRHVASLSDVDITRGDRADTSEAAKSATIPAAASQPEAGHWPAAPSPDAAADGDDLVPDPEDDAEASPTATTPPPSRPAVSPGAERRDELDRQRRAPEAPMQVDVPTLPKGTADNVLPLGNDTAARPRADQPIVAPRPAPTNPPAAAMLRAMDALRARDKRSELTSVYLRLVDLKERLAQSDRPAQK
ncbi:MerR family transcriptional regulator [Defluviimonas sp. SAOS-178_SWC]|uniref:MerR family transcriptional regulator n=1 Tax=Defluviimonas sp. SAOS-178_SWC TaxID=3121287 RepID=UPI00322220E1